MARKRYESWEVPTPQEEVEAVIAWDTYSGFCSEPFMNMYARIIAFASAGPMQKAQKTS